MEIYLNVHYLIGTVRRCRESSIGLIKSVVKLVIIL